MLPSPTLPPAPTIQTPTPEIVDQRSDLEEITPENLHRMEVTAQLGKGRIYDITVSPEGRVVAVYTASKIYLYDSTTLHEQGFIEVEPVTSEKRAITFSPDGDLLAFSTGAGIIFWDLSAWLQVRWVSSNIPEWVISDLEFSPDNRQIMQYRKSHF